MSKSNLSPKPGTPRLHVKLWPFTIDAEGRQAIDVIRWPVRILIVVLGLGLVGILITTVWMRTIAWSLLSAVF